MTSTETMTFPRTHQGVRNLDEGPANVLPVSGGPAHGPHEVNVGDPGRLLSSLGGGVLAAYGLSRHDLLGVGLALAGGAFIYRGVTGHCQLLSALGMSTARRPQPGTSREVVYRAR